MKTLQQIILSQGYKSIDHFTNSTFHPDSAKPILIATGASTGLAFYIETFIGLQLPAIGVLLVLFGMELFTGIKASYKEGFGWSTEKFGKGWLKLFVYVIMIGCSNMLAMYGPVESYFSYDFNHYKWLHYIFTNFVFFNLIISNLENFVRLGWEDSYGVITEIAKKFNLQVLKNKKDEREN